MKYDQSSTGKPVSLTAARRVVVKIGSSLLVDGVKNEIRQEWLSNLIEDIAACRARGQDVILVTSGSVALGRRVLKMNPSTMRLPETQAAAACGQVRLAHAYQETLAQKDLIAAQVLLTPGDTEERQPYLNVRATLRNLMDLGVIPVINENDTVTTPARRYGDNDRLAARVAAMVDADCLVLLSDIDGLFTADPSIDPQAQHIPEVRVLTPEICMLAGDSRSGFGKGGMKTKLDAARIAMNAGCNMVIARGNVLRPLRAIIDGGLCTWFVPNYSPAAARKVWIAGSLNPHGSLVIDEGARGALLQGKSLLSVGVTSVGGNFDRGDAVSILAHDGAEIARGLVAYSAAEARIIMGKRSDAFESLLGYSGREEIIHRDDMALL